MNRHEETNLMIREIGVYVKEHGEYPPRGVKASNGKDLGKATTRYRTGEIELTNEQIEMLAMIDDFLSRTEKNIQELEQYYKEFGHIPTGEDNKRLVDIIGTYKSGKVPVTANQRERLEAIGVLISNTERMIRSIEVFYKENGRVPGRGYKTAEGYDMGNAIIGYRRGKRLLTLDQKRRLELLGIDMSQAKIKDEPNIQVREISQKETELSFRIKQLKEEKASIVEDKIDERQMRGL